MSVGRAANAERGRLLAAVLAATASVSACGDGATEPPRPDPPRPTIISVSPATAALTALGATVQFSAEVRDQNGQFMPDVAVAWNSSTASVASVSVSGLVTAVGDGAATVTATAGLASGSATVTVTQEVSTVVVSPVADTLVAADTLRLVAEAADANGHPVAGVEFTWASSDDLVAVVDGYGLATGVGQGSAEIMATTARVTGTARLVVMSPIPTNVAVVPDTVVFTALGQATQFAAEVRDQIGRVMPDEAVSWTSDDASVAMVDSTGMVTAVRGGGTAIVAVAGSVSDTAVVTVTQRPGSVVVSPLADTIAPGDTLRLAAGAFDENGHAVVGAEFDWSSSDVSMVRVDAKGLVTGVVEGRATVTAATGDVRGAAEITVENPDRSALVALYHATDGLNWRQSDNWVTNAPLSEWRGVSVNAEGRVVRLRLHWQGLAGLIPQQLGDLTSLEELWLHGNDLSGRIPPALGNLSSLKVLWLYANNALTGPIPLELNNLAELEDLRLGGNRLNGPIPPELGNLASLKYLHLDNAGLTGPIPPQLGNLASLKELWLYGNGLTGSIPPELGDLANLEILELSENPLTGSIPQNSPSYRA